MAKLTLQPGQKIIAEITKTMRNYTIILNQANLLDSEYICDHTQNLLYALFKCCIPTLATELESLGIPEEEKESIRELIESLYRLKKGEITKTISIDVNISHESPIVHLLHLAVEKHAISWCRKSGAENWGRLTGFSEYLEKLKFEEGTDRMRAPYWPGLPTCVMTYLPIEAPQVQIGISTSLDKFEYFKKSKRLFWETRAKRLDWLQNQCTSTTAQKIDAVKKFSRELRDESKWEMIFENVDQLDSHNCKFQHFRPHDIVPIYLPIVGSTWQPNGRYLRSCLLDGIRFAMLRPPAAEKMEQSHGTQKEGKNRRILPETSCAEWDAFVNVLSSPRYTQTTWY